MTVMCAETQIDAGSHTTYFQKLLTLFLIKGYEINDFRIWVEKTKDNKFEDIIFEDENEKVLLQVKLGRKSNEGINFEKFFNPNEQWKEYIEAFIKMKTKGFKKLENVLIEAEQSQDNESLKLVRSRFIEIQDLFDKNYDEYKKKISSFNTEINSIKSLISEEVYKGVKHFLKHELHVVFTNVPTNDSKKYENNLFTTESFDESFILRSDAIFFYYNFNTQQAFEILSHLNISKQIIKYFLETFRVVSAGEDSIHEAVQDCVINHNIFRDVNDLTINNIFYKPVNKYFKNEICHHDYFDRIHFLSFLSELWNKNLVEKLTKHVKKINFKLDIIQNHSRLIIKTSRRYLLMLKLLQELNKKQETRFLFVDLNLDIRFQCYMIESFELSKYKYLICFIPSDDSEIYINAIKQMTNKIRNQHDKKIILITAEDISIAFPQNFHNINDQELFNNCTKINVDKIISMGGELENCYISRTLKSSNGEQISEETILKNALEGKHKIILLSDSPGMGKTALFRQLTCSINQSKSVWAIHIEMSHYTEELLKNIHPTLETLLDIEDDFEREVLTLPQKLILLIDSIDELFPENEKLFFIFLGSLQKSKNIKFVFVASRLNIQNILENFLGITAYKLLEFSTDNCYELVGKYWKSRFELQEEYDIKECYELFRTLDPFSKYKSPLEIKIIAYIVYNYYQQSQTKIEFNNIRVYRTFFEAKKAEIIKKRYREGVENNKNNRILQKIVNVLLLKITEGLKNLAVKMLFSENKLKYFNVDLDENYSLLWETLRSVELTKYCNGIYQLEQRVFAEYLIAEIIWKQLTSEKNFFKDFAEYFIRDIVEEKNGKYQFVRSFLNELLQIEWKNLPPNTFEVCSSIIDSRVTDSSINLNLLPIIQENHIFILKLLLINSKGSEKIINGINALYLAHNNLPMLKFLNSKGGDLNRALDLDGNKLIHIVDDSETIGYLISEGVDINSANNLKQTAVHQAALKNDINTIKYLIGNKANVNIQDHKGRTPLHLAVQSGTLETVQYLVEIADVNIKDSTNISLIYEHAALGGNVEIFKYLEKYFGVKKIFIEDKLKDNLLHFAIKGSFQHLAQYLMEQEIKLLKTNSSKLFEYGYLYGRESDILKYLVEKGANINAKTNNGETVLHRAVVGGNLDIVQYLVENGAAVDATDNHKKTVLHLAASKGHFNIVQYLVEQKANIRARSKNGQTVLHEAIIGGNLKIIDYFIDLGIDVNIKTSEGETPLHIAARGQLEIVKFLCLKKADATIQDNVGQTPIDKANQIGRLDILDYFQKESGRYITKEVVENNQILRHFLQQYDFRESQFLCLKNADATIQDNVGQTPIDKANQIGRCDILDCFQQESGRYITEEVVENNQILRNFQQQYDSRESNTFQYLINKPSSNKFKYQSARIEIDDTMWNNWLDLVKYLVQDKSFLNKRCDDGKTALHYAVNSGNFEIVKLLIENHYDLNLKDKFGQTALHLAVNGEWSKINFTKNIAQSRIQHNLKINITIEHEMNIANHNILVR